MADWTQRFCYLYWQNQKKQPHLSLRAIHIHHGLSQNADNWAIHCRQICQKLDISFLCEKVTINPRKGIEADAREARYQAIANHLQDNEILLPLIINKIKQKPFVSLKRGSGLQIKCKHRVLFLICLFFAHFYIPC